MNYNRLALLLCLILMVPFSSVFAEDVTVEELYREAEQKYIQFQADRAEELLLKALRKNPDHQKSRNLLDEMGREVPSRDELIGDTEPEEKKTETKEEISESSEDTVDSPSLATEAPADTDIQKNEEEAETEAEAKTSPSNAMETAESDSPSDDQRIVVPDQPAEPEEPSIEPILLPGEEGDTPEFRASGERAPPLVTVESDTGDQSEPDDGSAGLISPALGGSGDEPSTAEGGEGLVLPPPGPGAQSASGQSYRPNLNTATKDELNDELSESLTNRIIEQRGSEGYFLDWTDFRERVAPGGSAFENIREQFTLGIPIVNINSASAQELSSLPYLTRDVAEDIVNFRFTYGSFSSVEELMDVPDISELTFERVSPYLEAR